MPSKRKAPDPTETDAPEGDAPPADQAPDEQTLVASEDQAETTATPETGDTPPQPCPPGSHTYKNLVNLDGSPTSNFANQRCTNCGAERRVT